jgi:uncharacterized lipoprotein YehR (DUF1307 family)
MKKLLILFSIIGVITLTSCGAQEECRSRGSYVNQQEVKQLNIIETVSIDTKQDIN